MTKWLMFYSSEKPSKPTGPIEILDVQRDSITVQWNPPKHDGGSPLTAYVLEKRDAKRTMWSKVDRIGPKDTKYTFDGLTEGCEYYFRVAAENKIGLSEPLETATHTKAKSPFSKFRIENISFQYIYLVPIISVLV